jgi:hypothetical protein
MPDTTEPAAIITRLIATGVLEPGAAGDGGFASSRNSLGETSPRRCTWRRHGQNRVVGVSYLAPTW